MCDERAQEVAEEFGEREVKGVIRQAHYLWWTSHLPPEAACDALQVATYTARARASHPGMANPMAYFFTSTKPR